MASERKMKKWERMRGWMGIRWENGNKEIEKRKKGKGSEDRRGILKKERGKKENEWGLGKGK